MANAYVQHYGNSFEEVEELRSDSVSYNRLTDRGLLYSDNFSFRFRQITKDDVTNMAISVEFTSTKGQLGTMDRYVGDWAFLRNGHLIIQLNGTNNIRLEPFEISSDVLNNGITASYINEVVGYVIDNDILKDICEAQTVMMQISGDSGCWVLDGKKLQFMAKAMYNACVDETAYVEEAFKKKGCYVATAVYGSYDCPEVWTLRRFRDFTLDNTFLGRAFIKSYYAISPTLVKWFGNTNWFRSMWKPVLDRLVNNLKAKGIEDSPYNDKY